MREVSAPVMVHNSDLSSASAVLHHRATNNPDHVAFGKQANGEVVDVTTAKFLEEVRAVAAGLVAAGVGVGDRVGIMSPTCYEWSLASFAIWEVGGVVVPIHSTASVSQVKKILGESEADVIFAKGMAESDVIREASPDYRIWSFDETGLGGLQELVLLGESSAVEVGVKVGELDRRVRATTPDDLASIVFTSGTTGNIKGVRITHGNFVRLSLQVAGAYEEVVNEQASTIILLPLAHVLAQGLQLVSVLAGMKIVHEGNPQKAIQLMGEVQPTFMVVVPRVLEKIRDAAMGKAQEKKLGWAFAMAENTAIAWGEYLEKTQRDPSLKPHWNLKVQRRIFDRLFYRRIRSLLGGKIEYLLSGASALNADLGNFFRGAGIPVLEGYGLTETTAPITGNRPGKMRAGSVGTPIPGSVIRISDQGEVQVKGVGVTPGYLDPADDLDAFESGFYRTGDLGRLDEDGYLYIHGRLKNIIVTANGKNIAPEPWEQTIAKDPLVGHAVMVGENKPYAAAIIVLEPEEAMRWAKTKGITELVKALTAAEEAGNAQGTAIGNKDILDHIQRVVDTANSAVSRAERVRRIAVITTPLSEENGMLTPTQKLRRSDFLEQHSTHILRIYKEKTKS